MVEFSSGRRKILGDLLMSTVGVILLPSYSTSSQEGYTDELERRFLESLSLKEQFSTLLSLEKASIRNTGFAEEFQRIGDFIRTEINPPEIEFDTDVAGCQVASDKIVLSYSDPKTWLTELRRGRPDFHYRLHHERVHLLDDNYSQIDRFQDLLCKHKFLSPNKSWEDVEEEYASFWNMISKNLSEIRDTITPLLTDYKRTFGITADSMDALLEDFKERWKKYAGLVPEASALTEAHSLFVTSDFVSVNGISPPKFEEDFYEILNFYLESSISVGSPKYAYARGSSSNLINNLETLYGTLLKRNVEIPQAHIEVAKIVGDNMYDDGSKNFQFHKLKKAAAEMTERLKVTPEEARGAIYEKWIPYKAGIHRAVGEATETYLKDNFGKRNTFALS